MKILLFIAIGFIAGYIAKDLLTKESEVIYHIKRLRANRGGEVSVNADVILDKSKPISEQKDRKSKRKQRIAARKNK